MSWIERILNKSNITQTRKASIPEGVWTKCDSCGQVLYRAELERNLEVCPKCDHHMRMTARMRLHTLLDEGSEVELGCLTGESVLGADWSVLAARAFEAGVGEPTCAGDSVMAPSNAAVPQMRFLRRLNIGLNGS